MIGIGNDITCARCRNRGDTNSAVGFGVTVSNKHAIAVCQCHGHGSYVTPLEIRFYHLEDANIDPGVNLIVALKVLHFRQIP